MSVCTVEVREASYIDHHAGNDKFYRVYLFGNCWVAQYGRNGTLGSFTKVVEAASSEAAAKAASAKFASKVKKGYQPSRSGTVNVPGQIDPADLTVLDKAAQALGGDDGTSFTGAADPVPAVALEIDAPRLPDLTESVAAALSDELTPWAAADTDMSPPLPVRPMLASVQPAETVEDAMYAQHWIAQFKYDGDRVVVEVADGQIRVLNRQGQPKVRNVGQSHLHPFTALHSGRWVFDGEVVGRTLVLFDLAAATDGTRTWVHEASGFDRRYAALAAIASALGLPLVADAEGDIPVVLAPIAATWQAKEGFLTTAVDEQREGIILRHRAGTYESGRRSAMLVKHKLIKDADVVVTSLSPVKESAELAVYDEHGELVRVGSASTIGKGEIEAGQTWVVTFLYVNDPAHPRLVQPRLVRRRTDKSARECGLGQFADAGTNKAL